MKYLIATAAILVACTANAEVSNIKVFEDVQVPVYQQGQSNGGDVLLGAILGGLIGGTATGKDEGAAIGAIGGAIIADQNANKPKVSGYRLERQCNDVTVYRNSNVEVYSHSTVRFYLDGKRYVVPFQK